MPNAKLDIRETLVRRLVAGQFPEWADLPVRPVAFDGWDNRTFRLGDDLSVRLPSAAGYVGQIEKEHRWLPVLAPQLPLPIPTPIAKGQPADGYPWPWSIYRWLPGEIASVARIDDLAQFARDVAGFLVALAAIDPTGGPGPGHHNFYRGGSLMVYDAETRQAIIDLGDRIDGAAALEVWETALAATWDGPPVWFHGDIATGNLLVLDGRLGAVIDFGTSGVGDPACDLAITWTLFSGDSREAYRAAYPADQGMWSRGRAWTLWKALIVAAGLAQTNNPEGDRALEIANDVIGDHVQFG